jgi:hypothetical protein
MNENILASGMETNDWMDDITPSHHYDMPSDRLFRETEVPLLRSYVSTACRVSIDMPLLRSFLQVAFNITGMVIQSPIGAKAQ